MSGTEKGHQVYGVVFHTPVNDFYGAINGMQVMESMRGTIASTIAGVVNLSNFLTHGFSQVEQVNVNNLRFAWSGSDGKIPFRHIDILWEIDITSDPTWVEYTELIALIGGLASLIVGGIIGNPILIGVGILLLLSFFFLVATELLREVISNAPQVAGLLALMIVGGVVGYYALTHPRR